MARLLGGRARPGSSLQYCLESAQVRRDGPAHRIVNGTGLQPQVRVLLRRRLGRLDRERSFGLGRRETEVRPPPAGAGQVPSVQSDVSHAEVTVIKFQSSGDTALFERGLVRSELKAVLACGSLRGCSQAKIDALNGRHVIGACVEGARIGDDRYLPAKHPPLPRGSRYCASLARGPGRTRRAGRGEHETRILQGPRVAFCDCRPVPTRRAFYFRFFRRREVPRRRFIGELKPYGCAVVLLDAPPRGLLVEEE